MKKTTLLVLVGILALAFAFTACGDDDEKDVCEQAGDIFLDAWDAACADYPDCEACNADPTTGEEGEEQECTGDIEAQAQTCVDDKAACEEGVKALVDMACSLGV